jgi:hypothetical protein
MIDNFFQKKSPDSPSLRGTPTLWGSFLFRSLFYTSFLGFIMGLAFGYLHIKGWISNADKGLILYAVAFGIGALLSASFVLYQSRQNQRKVERIKLPRNNF